jgi:hypothetical protein
MMRILASRGVFEEKSEGCFTLTSAAEFLRTDNPYSLRDANPDADGHNILAAGI